MDLLPNGITPIGTSSPACAPPSHMQVNSRPQAGNLGFELFCEGAPANAGCLLVFGVPGPGTVLLGATIHEQVPVLAGLFLFSDARGFARFNLPIPVGLPMPAGLAAQYLWLLPTPCGGALAGASNALGL
jgi:hypothetical protein